jgi:hypothetical protein
LLEQDTDRPAFSRMPAASFLRTGITFSDSSPEEDPMTERQLHIRAYRAARGAGLDSDAANAVAEKVVERCLTNTPSLHDSHARIDPLVVDRITRRMSLASKNADDLQGTRAIARL